MKYLNARSQIRSGDVLAWSHRGWGTWHDIKIQGVRFFTQSEFSHVGLAWAVAGRVLVIEAVTPLVRIFPLSGLLDQDCFWLPSEANWCQETEDFALSKVGQPYSQMQAMQAFFHLPTEDSQWQCAELVRSVLKKDGLDVGDKATPTAIVRHRLMNGARMEAITP